MSRTPFPRLKTGLVAILRGLTFDEVEPVVGGLIEAGFEAIEIPLNSPDPFRSIERAVRLAPDGVLIGAGTVLQPAQVDRLAEVGGRLLVSPNIDPAVMERASAHGMVTMPGVMTPTEAFTALACGASALKFFPASLLGPAGIKAVRAVLPKDAVVGAVGGVGPAEFASYAAVGVSVFGLGSNLYAPGMDAEEVNRRGSEAVAAYRALDI
ncbi:2-dehydro-3-deoxy-6-phosphogalactonate aldolase [Antarcticirhabdus aurantiaca]|uniref:2-dehydro-3-deoxy-6-phosphogalactonate aldolase n=1 Tax=Antarcticirhabdus aurantiaca TaxID=2606717 RepID=A0ACD4NL41_9HYPH|nr:2-dehydro-3-deoxy-6-phosphogalactonate aldolase [Antarcticirhabdus aurantiaca]WAJ27642.1 2-dehydro-3-deoxy-6-phosphogalactonate aldolase [Jeongeuplla avenae]